MSQHYGDVDTVLIQTGATPDSFVNIDTQQELEGFIETELEEASDAINRYCKRTFRLVQNDSHTFPGSGSDTVRLPGFPIQEIHSLTREGTELTEGTDFEIKQNRAQAGANMGILRRLENGKPRRHTVWRRHASFEIEYDWGFPEADIPPVLNGVAEDIVSEEVTNSITTSARGQAGGATSVSMDGFSVSYDVAQAAEEGTITETQLQRLKGMRNLEPV